MKRRRIIRPLGQEPASAPAPHAPGHSPARLLSASDIADYEAAVISEAAMFSVTRFEGRGVYDTHEFPTLRQAVEKVADMGVDRTMVYAMNSAGRKVLVLAGGKRVLRQRPPRSRTAPRRGRAPSGRPATP